MSSLSEASDAGSTSKLPDTVTKEGTVISKRQAKKAAKRAAYEAAKPERKAKEKAARKAKAAHKRAHPEEYKDEPAKAKRRRKAVVPLQERPEFRTNLLVDLGGWDDKMSDREIISLTSQLCYCYNIVRHAEHRYKFTVADWSGRVHHRMSDEGPLRGHHKSWNKEADVELRAHSLQSMLDNGELNRSNVVYLTADSPNVLTSIEEGKTYVLGGIVDKNRYKVGLASV